MNDLKMYLKHWTNPFGMHRKVTGTVRGWYDLLRCRVRARGICGVLAMGAEWRCINGRHT